MKQYFQRTLSRYIFKDLDTKIVLLSGPRQTGKTTLGSHLMPEETLYLNYDRHEDRQIIRQTAWSRESELIIFDELHKMKQWKRWIKGIYDTEKVRPRLLVTGSARLDVYRRGGESLAGRHFLYRLHPISVAEAIQGKILQSPKKAQARLLKCGGFPEPFLSDDETFAKRWRKGHIDRILREDLLDLERVHEIKSIEILVDLLAERVGSPVSYSSLARDLEVAPKTVKHWIEVLERMFVIFVVTPYAKNIARALLKEPKVYFYDVARVTGKGGARLENLVACALLKRNQFLEDTKGDTRALHYIRDQQKREVDFFTLLDKRPEYLIEVKEADAKPTSALYHFSEALPDAVPIQLVGSLQRDLQFERIKVKQSASWLAQLES